MFYSRTAFILLATVFFAVTAWAEGPDQPPGAHFEVLPQSLPAPDPSSSVANPPDIVPRPADATLRVPPGFRAELFAEGLENARYLEVAPNGDVLLAEPAGGKITVLRDETGSGHATKRFTFAEGLRQPHGIAVHDGYVYVADTRRVWRYRWNPQDGTAASPAEPVTEDGALGDGAGHFTPRATITECAAAGGAGRVFASGLRNPVGVRFYPGTNELWAVVNERDGLGDGLVPDYFTHVIDGGFYGWPYAYLDRHPQPGLGEKRPDLVARTLTPDVLFQSHSAPLGLVFYDGTQFPSEYRGDAFVSLHGSWNAGEPRGYKVVRVRFHNGRPERGYENFATGFWLRGTKTAQVWGRPVGLTLAKDGSLLISDDVAETVWRVSWVGK
jgi:glucose/arabinose dehydrogenase